MAEKSSNCSTKSGTGSDFNCPNEDEYFSKIPPDFLKGTELVPHNFTDPENPIHSTYVTKQLRADLFNTAYLKLYFSEDKELEDDEDWYRLKTIKKYPCTEDSW